MFLSFILCGFLGFAQTSTIIAFHDAYTWDTNPGFNYGNKHQLITSNSDNDTDGVSHTREIYLKFNLISLSTVNSAKLRLTLKSGEATTRNYNAYLVSDDTWNEEFITWNFKPLSGLTPIASATNVGNTIEFDITTEVINEAAGDDKISIRVVSTQEDVASFIYSYDEILVLPDQTALDSQKPRLVINEPTLSIDEELDAVINNVAVYPNPTTNNINIKGLVNEETSIYVYNTLGQLLKYEKYNSNVDLSTLKDGLYYMKVISDNKQKIFKIIKK